MDIGSHAFFDDLYAQSIDPWLVTCRMSQHNRFISYCELLKRHVYKCDSILDIGCGMGVFTDILSDEYPEAKIIGIDFVERVIREAQHRASHKRNLSFETKNMLSLTYGDGTFDLVTMTEVFVYLSEENREKMLREIKRMLKGSGFFFLSTVINREHSLTSMQIIDRMKAHFEIVDINYTLYCRTHNRIERGFSYLIYRINRRKATHLGGGGSVTAFRKKAAIIFDIISWPLKLITNSRFIFNLSCYLSRYKDARARFVKGNINILCKLPLRA